jgi:hypothetical protein
MWRSANRRTSSQAAESHFAMLIKNVAASTPLRAGAIGSAKLVGDLQEVPSRWTASNPDCTVGYIRNVIVHRCFPPNNFAETEIMKITIMAPSISRYPDPEAHEPGCISEEPDSLGSDPIAGYVDLFCSCHRYIEPKLLSNGTDIAWPAGWTEDQAKQWRTKNGLAQLGAMVAQSA